MEEFADIFKVLGFGIFGMIGAYIACRGTFYNKFSHILLGSDLLAACAASVANVAFYVSIEWCFCIFGLVLVLFPILCVKTLSRDSR